MGHTVLRVHSHLRFNRRGLLHELFPKQKCIPVGCKPSAAVSVCHGGSALVVGGECLPRGVSPQGDVYPSMCWGRHLPAVDRIIDTRLWNIIFPQLCLRTVITCCTVLSMCIHTCCLATFVWTEKFYSGLYKRFGNCVDWKFDTVVLV